MTVAELLARVSSAEITEWQAFFKLQADEIDEVRKHGELKAEASAGVEARKRRMRA